MNSVCDTVAALEKKRHRAMIEADEGALSQLLSGRMTYVHSTSVIDTKVTYLDAMRTGKLRYSRIEPFETDANALEKNAVMITGRIRIWVTTLGDEKTLDCLYTAIWVREGGDWQLLRWQSTDALH